MGQVRPWCRGVIHFSYVRDTLQIQFSQLLCYLNLVETTELCLNFQFFVFSFLEFKLSISYFNATINVWKYWIMTPYSTSLANSYLMRELYITTKTAHLSVHLIFEHNKLHFLR